MSTLFVVATPIGNLGDLSPRAGEVLASVQIIGCEDTRRTGTLMQHIGGRSGRFVVVNEHTEFEAAQSLLEALDNGEDVALVSDAGTPAISDPGLLVVRAAIEAGHSVVPIPGPSAVIAALSVSGLDTRRFVYEGFLPREGKDRSDRIAMIRKHPYTTVIYEAPHRVERTLVDLKNAMGEDRKIVLARELTKMHETLWRGSIAEAVELFANSEPIGEYVIMIEGAPERSAPDDATINEALSQALSTGASVKDAANDVAEVFGLPKRDLYERALRLRPRNH